MSIALVFQHPKCMSCIIFSLYYLINGTIFGKIIIVLTFWCSPQLFSETFLILRKPEWDIIIKVRRSSFKVPVLMKIKFSWQISPKRSSIKFSENPSRLSRDVPCGRIDIQTETDRQTDVTKLIVAFRNFSKAPIISNSKRILWLLGHFVLKIKY